MQQASLGPASSSCYRAPASSSWPRQGEHITVSVLATGHLLPMGCKSWQDALLFLL